jgi:glycosyltransferase involved in cell wall biosynthesis
MPDAALKIALVSTQHGWRGGEIQAALLARGLRDSGHDVTVLAAANAPLRHRMAAERIETRDLTAPASPLTLTRTRGYLKRFRPDVVHFNDPRAMSTVGPAIAGLGVRARVISRRVDYPLRNPTAYRLLADSVVCVSEAVRRRCAEAGLPAGRLVVVPDGVDPQGWRQRTPVSLTPSRVRLLAVGALIADKGHAHLIRALAQLHVTHPEVRLAIAGQGPERDALARVAAGIGLSRHIDFLGHRDDVPTLMRQANILVHPSVAEGLASVLIEAMCVGLPIVASRTGGIPELIAADPAPLGRLVPPADPDALARSIAQAIDEYRDSHEMAQRARRRARSCYTHQHMVDRTYGAYCSILAAGQRRSAT